MIDDRIITITNIVFSLMFNAPMKSEKAWYWYILYPLVLANLGSWGWGSPLLLSLSPFVTLITYLLLFPCSVLPRLVRVYLSLTPYRTRVLTYQHSSYLKLTFILQSNYCYRVPQNRVVCFMAIAILCLYTRVRYA